MKLPWLVLLLAAVTTTTGCGGGTKLVRTPGASPPPMQALHAEDAGGLAATVEYVIVRNGPGAWAKNADWDEYILQVRNTGNGPIQIRGIELIDAQGQQVRTLDDRKALVVASKQALKRYRDAGIKVQAGRDGRAMVAAGVGAGVIGYGAATAAATSAALGGGAAGGSAAAAAGGFILAAPVLVGVGVVRMVNNGKVNERIKARSTTLPLTLAAGEGVAVDVFFPISPGPRQLVVHYTDPSGDRLLALDTDARLGGLHLVPPATANPGMR